MLTQEFGHRNVVLLSVVLFNGEIGPIEVVTYGVMGVGVAARVCCSGWVVLRFAVEKFSHRNVVLGWTVFSQVLQIHACEIFCDPNIFLSLFEILDEGGISAGIEELGD